MRIKNYSSLICSLALLILQGCKSPVVELSGIPTYLLDPLTISKEYECYSYSPSISRSDRELANDSVYSQYVRFKDGWFTLRLTVLSPKTVRLYAAYSLKKSKFLLILQILSEPLYYYL